MQFSNQVLVLPLASSLEMTYLTPVSGSTDRMGFGKNSSKTYAEVFKDSGYTNYCIQEFQKGDCCQGLKRYAQWAICQQAILPSGLDRMGFGKNSSKTYAEVFKDSGYTNYCIQEFQKGDCCQGLKRYAQWAICQQAILPSGSDRMGFGKNSSKTYAEVFKDSGYTNYCIQEFQKGDCCQGLKRYAQWAIRQQAILPSGSDRMGFGKNSSKTYAEVFKDSGYTNYCIQEFQKGDCCEGLKRYAQWAIRQQPVVVVTSPKSTSPSLESYSMVTLPCEVHEVEDEVSKRIDKMAEELRVLKLKTMTAAQQRVKWVSGAAFLRSVRMCVRLSLLMPRNLW